MGKKYGYKGFNVDEKGNLYCSPSSKRKYYKLGEIVEQDGKLEIYKNGIYFCWNLNDVYEFKVFENGSVQNWNAYNLEKSCLTYEQISDYVCCEKTGYAWHIDDLKIYDKPKELSEFKFPNKPIYYEDNKKAIYGYSVGCKLTRPPQSYMFVEELEE